MRNSKEYIVLKYRILEIDKENLSSLSLRNRLGALILDRMAQSLQGPCSNDDLPVNMNERKVIIGKCNIEENNDLAVKFKIWNVLRMLVIWEENEISKIVEAVRKD